MWDLGYDAGGTGSAGTIILGPLACRDANQLIITPPIATNPITNGASHPTHGTKATDPPTSMRRKVPKPVVSTGAHV
jgi:hypothetical protein